MMFGPIAHTIPIRQQTSLRVLACTLSVLLTSSLLFAQSTVTSDQQIVIRFVQTPTTSNPVVRLNDLIEVAGGFSSSLESLMNIPLGPAPRFGQTQSWHRDDVLQHLELRGLHPSNLRWSGTETAKLQRTDSVENQLADHMLPAFVNSQQHDQSTRNAVQAIKEYLNLNNGERIEWQIKIQIPANALPLLSIRRNITSIGGGESPWIGQQEFVLQVKKGEQLVNIPVTATVAPPPTVIVAKRAIRRDELITEDMLTFASLNPRNAGLAENCFTQFEDCVGTQARRSISKGQPLEVELLGRTIVVRRNEMVEVEAVSGSVVVRSAAKALGTGAIGDLLEIELPTRQRIHATVVGQSLVRIAAVANRSSEP